MTPRLQLDGQMRQDVGARRVELCRRLEIQHECSSAGLVVDFGKQSVLERRRVRPEQRRIEPHDDDAVHGAPVGVVAQPAPGSLLGFDLAQHVHARSRRSVDDRQQRRRDRDTEPWQRSEEDDSADPDRSGEEVCLADPAVAQ